MIDIHRLWDMDWEPMRPTIDTVWAPADTAVPIGFLSRAAMGSGGQFAVIDSLTQDVWVRRREEGKGWRRILAKGDGPFEIGLARGLWWSGDTLTVFDAARRNLLRLHAHDASSTAMPFPEQGSVSAQSSDGSAVFFFHEEFPDVLWKEGLHHTAVGVYAMTNSGTTELGMWSGRAWARAGPTGYGPAPFGARGYFGSAGERLVIAEPATSAIELLGRTGEVTTVIRWGDSRVAMTDALRERFFSAMLEAAPSSQRSRARELLEQLPFPDSLPALGGLVAGPSVVVLSGFWGQALPNVWLDGFEEHHRIIGTRAPVSVRTLVLPRNSTPLASFGDSLLLIRLEGDLGRDGLGVARIPLSFQ